MSTAFGPFEFDSAAGELWKNGLRLRLRGQPLEILGVLVAKPGQVVTREELQQQLWKGSTFVDFDHGLNAAVNKLRQALLDDADRPRYIETVPGVGYRFVAPITGAPTTPTVPAPRQFPWTWAALASIPALLAVAFWIGRASTPTARPEPVRFQITVPANLELTESESFSLSPDGRTLVYGARSSDGRTRLWAQGFDAKEPHVIPGTESTDGAPSAIWSPDSKSFLYDSAHSLFRVDLLGNPPALVCHVSSTVLGGDWNADGTVLFGTETQGIMRVSAKGGDAVPITRRDAAKLERVHGWPRFLPDGKHFLYSRLSAISANNGIYIRSLDTPADGPDSGMLVHTTMAADLPNGAGSPVLLYQRERTLWAQNLNTTTLALEGNPRVVVEGVGSYRALGFFFASRNGDRLVYRATPPVLAQLAWRDRSGKPEQSLGEPSLFDDNGPPAIAPDGTKLVASRFEGGNSDIWGYDLTRAVSQKLTFNPSIDLAPVWSADGSRVFYSSGPSGHYDLYQIPARGGPEQLLYASPQTKFPSSASPDGRYLTFETQTNGSNWDVWLLPLTGGSPSRLLATDADERSAKISPDGKWLAFVSNESGRPEVYVQRFGAASVRTQVSNNGGYSPRWQPGSQILFYARPDRMLVSVSVDGFKPGTPHIWFQLPSDDWVPARGNRFLVSEPLQQPVEPFTTVLNWQTSK